MKFTIIIWIALFACSLSAQSQKPVPMGVWGGKGIELRVTAKGGVIDYGCESGTINGRLRTDSRGKFSARGTHSFGSGGPSSPGDQALKPREALYVGMWNGNRIDLTVSLPELKRTLGNFTIHLGQRPTLERCG